MSAAALAFRSFRESSRRLIQAIDPRLSEPPMNAANVKKAEEAWPFTPMLQDAEVDWALYHKHLPYHYNVVNALRKFYEKEVAHLKDSKPFLPPRTHAAILAKLDEAEQVGKYAEPKVAAVESDLHAKLAEFRKYEESLEDILIVELSAQHPDWRLEVADDIYHMRWEIPHAGTALEGQELV